MPCGFRLGPAEIGLIALLIVVLFGAKKVPDIMGGLGVGLRRFKRGLTHDEGMIGDIADELNEGVEGGDHTRD